MDDLATMLKELRDELKLSQRELAQSSGLTASYISKIENENLSNPPSSDALTSLARALNVDELNLLTAAGRVPSPFDVIGGQPEAARFFRRAAERIHSGEDWDRLAEVIDSPAFAGGGSAAEGEEKHD
jgi:transcriptional regulator with XRE-family HTH domain